MSKQPVSPLSVISVRQDKAGEEAPSNAPNDNDTAFSPLLKPKEEVIRVAMTLRPKRQHHRVLKRAAQHTGRSMQEFLDEALEEWLRSRKLIT